MGEGSTIGAWLTSNKDSGAAAEVVVRADCALALAIVATSTAPLMAMRILHIATLHKLSRMGFCGTTRDPTQIFTQSGGDRSQSEGRARRELNIAD